MLQKRIHIIVQLYLGTGIECAVCVCMDFFKYMGKTKNWGNFT